MRGKFRLRRPSPSMIIAIVALVAALTGTAYAAKLGLGALSGKAKDKTIGVGKLTYVNTSQSVTPSPSTTVDATITSPCPGGLKVIGGSTKSPSNTDAPTGGFGVVQQYPTSGGWTSQVSVGGPSELVQVTAICAASRKVSGSPPPITP
jgi:hypothetical protein